MGNTICCVRFLLNPAAVSEDHMVQFRFLGILMAVAIRTKKPLDLHLAPWVWKQLCSIPLSGQDLEEVDLLTYRSLQGILHLDNSGITEENFSVVRHSEWHRHARGPRTCGRFIILAKTEARNRFSKQTGEYEMIMQVNIPCHSADDPSGLLHST